MNDIQSIFSRIEENKAKMKDLKTMIKDAMSNSLAYQEAVEEAKVAAEKRKSVKKGVEAGLTDVLMQLDDLKIDIESDQELLSDAAMTKLMKGESVGVTDKYDNDYEPNFTVKFKKIT